MMATKSLPPGQRQRGGFPRFGSHLSKRAPAIPADPVIDVSGAVVEGFAVPISTLASLPRRALTADFHCVAGWSATDLRWEGVAFETFYRAFIEPAILPGTSATHIVFTGLDGWRSVVTLEDALADDVLIAEHLHARPLDSDHGAPARVVSPRQYGYVSTKHLCGIAVHTTAPSSEEPLLARILFGTHPRARVWEEERHGFLPARLVRPVYRALIGPIASLSARGGEGARNSRR